MLVKSSLSVSSFKNTCISPSFVKTVIGEYRFLGWKFFFSAIEKCESTSFRPPWFLKSHSLPRELCLPLGDAFLSGCSRDSFIAVSGFDSDVLAFAFILFGVFSASWMCRFLFFCQIWKVFSCYFFNFFFFFLKPCCFSLLETLIGTPWFPRTWMLDCFFYFYRTLKLCSFFQSVFSLGQIGQFCLIYLCIYSLWIFPCHLHSVIKLLPCFLFVSFSYFSLLKFLFVSSLYLLGFCQESLLSHFLKHVHNCSLNYFCISFFKILVR